MTFIVCWSALLHGHIYPRVYLFVSDVYVRTSSHIAGLPSDIAHFISCGADKVLLKPLDIEAFKEAMM